MKTKIVLFILIGLFLPFFSYAGVNFSSVKIVKDNVISGNEKAAGSITTTDTYYPFGGSTDLWGLTWDYADINDSTFGVVYSFVCVACGDNYTSHYLNATNFGFSIPAGATIDGILAEVEAKSSSFGGTTRANVDHIRITVYFTEEEASPSVQTANPSIIIFE